jgi:hypothetical protein
MPKLHLPAIHSPGSIDPEAAGNGATPRSSFLRRAADGMNTVATYHKKLLTAKFQEFGNVVSGSGSIVSPWPFYFRTGENTVGIQIYMGIVDTDYGAAVNPRVGMTVRLAADASIVDGKYINYNGRSASLSSAEVINKTSLVTTRLVGLSPNTEYYMPIDVHDGGMLVYLMVYEIAERHADDSVTGIVDPTKFLADGPIYDEHIEDLLDSGAQMWKHNGCHCLSWNPDYGTTLALTATSFTNLSDQTSTSYSSATPGVTLAAQHHGTATTGAAGPAVKMAVQAVRTSGAGTLDVRLTDGTNTISVTGISAGGVGQWYTATGNIPDAISKWDIQGKVTSGTFQIKAVCLFSYEV